MLRKIEKINPDIIIYFAVVIFLAYNMAFVDDSFKHFRNVAFIWTYFVVSRRQIRLDIGDALIFTGMLSYYWIWKYSFLEGLILALKVTSMYQIGKYLTDPVGHSVQDNNQNSDSQKIGMFTVLLIAILFFIRGILDYSWLINNDNYIEWPDIYGIMTLRTHHEFYLVTACSLLAVSIIFFTKLSKILGVVLFTISVTAYFAAIKGNTRLAVVGGLFTSFLILFFWVFENKLFNKRIVIIGIIIVFGFFGGIFSLFYYNIHGLKDWYISSGWARDGGILHNIRFQIFRKSISLLKDYPFGHCDVSVYKSKTSDKFFDYAHNSWLDIGRRGGVIPLALTVCFTLTNIYSLIRLWINSKGAYKYALISAFLGIIMYNGFESGIMSKPTYIYWNTGILLGGLINGYYLSKTGTKEMIISLI